MQTPGGCVFIILAGRKYRNRIEEGTELLFTVMRQESIIVTNF